MCGEGGIGRNRDTPGLGACAKISNARHMPIRVRGVVWVWVDVWAWVCGCVGVGVGVWLCVCVARCCLVGCSMVWCGGFVCVCVWGVGDGEIDVGGVMGIERELRDGCVGMKGWWGLRMGVGGWLGR